MAQLETYQIDYVHMAQIPGYVQRHVNMAYLQKYIKSFSYFYKFLNWEKEWRRNNIEIFSDF